MSALKLNKTLKNKDIVTGNVKGQNKIKSDQVVQDLKEPEQELVAVEVATKDKENIEYLSNSEPVLLAQSSPAENSSEVPLNEDPIERDKGVFIKGDGARLAWVGVVAAVAYVGARQAEKDVSPQEQAMSSVKDYAQRNTDNTATQPSGVAPTVATYAATGVKGVTESNLRAINNILETALITGESVSTTAKLQEVVDSYNAVLAFADGKANNATASQGLTVKQISSLGIDTTGLINGNNPEQRMSLLNNLLDSKSSASVDSVAKIQAMVKWVNDLSDFSAGKSTVALAFTPADFSMQGVSGVYTSNLPVLLDEIKKSGAGSIGSMGDISALITKSNTRITAAFQAIQNYAQANTDPTAAATGIAPSVQNYQDAGVLRLDSTNKDAVNTALTTLNVGANKLQTTADIQKVVDAYSAVFALTEGNPNNATAQQSLTLATLNTLGADTTQLSAASDVTQRLSLLNNVLDGKSPSDVNTISKVNDLVKLVNALEDQSTGTASNPPLTPADFQRLGVVGVTDANVTVLLDEIKKSGSGSIDSLSDISSLITKSNTRIADAFVAIQSYAQANTDPTAAATGTAPSVQNYQDVGVLRLDANNKDAVNSALTTLNLKSDNLQTRVDIQKVVDAYNAVLALAEGTPNNATPQKAITLDTLNNLGVNTTPLSSGTGASQRLSLLNTVLDAQQKTGVGTIDKVNDLVKLVNAVEDQSGGITPNPQLTTADFQRLGISGVTDANLAVLLDEIKQSGAGSIGSMGDISALVTKSNTRITAAFQAIQNYAQANTDPTAAPTSIAPSVQNYQDVGVLRLDANNKDAVNSALTTLNLKSDNLQTTGDIQKVVDAYNAVFALAEGNPHNATAQQALTLATLNTLGADTTQLSAASDVTQRLSLLNNVLDGKSPSDVNTISKVNDWVKLINAITDKASGVAPSYSMQAQDFAKLGIVGVDAANLSDIQQSIAAQQTKTPLTTLNQLQHLVDFYKIAPLGVLLVQDTGVDSTDLVTNNGDITVNGTPQADATLTYSVDGGVTYTNAYLSPSVNGPYTVWVRQVSKEGYLGKSSQLTFTYDTHVPAATSLDAGILYFGTKDTLDGNTKAVASNAVVPNTQDIAKIQLSLANVDATHDKWLLGGKEINLNGAPQQANNQTVGGVSIDWQYVTSTNNNHTINITKNGGGKFTDAQVEAIEKVMAFKSLGGSEGQRLLTLLHSDVAGNIGTSATRTLEVDLTSPVIQLTSNTANYFANLRATATAATTGLSSAASIADTAPIKSLNVQAKSLQDNERLVINNGADASVNLYGGNANGSATVGGVNGGAWQWSYSSATNAVAFTLTNGLNASAAQASALLQALQYQNTNTTSGHSALREFTFTTTDAAGNESVAATTTINYVATVAKVATTAALDGNADGALGDQFVVSFTELVEVTKVQNSNNWSIANSIANPPNKGTIDIKAVDVQTIGGVDYAKHFWVKSGADSANWVVGQQQTFNFGNQTGTNQQAYLTLPTKTFGGDLTLEAWLYMDKAPGSFARIFDLGTSQFQTAGPNPVTGTPTQGSDNILFGFDVSKKLFFQIYQGQTSQSLLTTDTAISLNTWYHLAVTIDASKKATIYINGAADKTAQFTVEANVIARDHSYINKSAWAGDGYLSGNIFDARVYDNAKTATEIKNDFKGMVDPSDLNQVFWYNLNGDLNSGLTNTAAAIGANITFDNHNPGTTFTIQASNVVDSTGQATATQVATLYKSSGVNGSFKDNQLVGTAGDDFITGQGGNDNLTGGLGRDVFAWLKGNTGTDTVTDFKVAEGDTINLSGILSGTGVNSANVSQYLQWTQTGNNAELKIHTDGNVNNVASKTIIFTDGYLHGLNDTLQNLVNQKVIVLG